MGAGAVVPRRSTRPATSERRHERGPRLACSACMRFSGDDQADASQVDDRRGEGGFRFPGGRLGVGAGGLGVVGTLVYLAFQLLGGNVTTPGAPAGTQPGDPNSIPPSAPGSTNAALGGSCQGASS